MTECEISKGILNAKDVNQHVFCIERKLIGLDKAVETDGTSDPTVAKYIEVQSEGNKVN